MMACSSVMCQNTKEALQTQQDFKFNTSNEKTKISVTPQLSQVVSTSTAKSKTEHEAIVIYSCLMCIHIDGRYS